MSIILPSVPMIYLFYEFVNVTYVGKSRQLSLVPENPMQVLTLQWSQEEEVIDH
jgi:hypothetical protein